MELNLKGKCALVFGSSMGIGRGVAEALLREGAAVGLLARHADTLEKVKVEMGAQAAYAVDLTKSGAARDAVKKFIRDFGRIDILITNTGGPARGEFLDIPEKQWRDDFQSLWMSVVEALDEALPIMKSQKFGRVIMITSLAAAEPIAGLTTSNGFRAGLTGLCKSISNEVAPFGVTVNTIRPGYINTRRIQENKWSPEKIREMVPAGRLGEPREIGELTAFLASEKAAYITGQSIAVDGGRLRGI